MKTKLLATALLAAIISSCQAQHSNIYVAKYFGDRKAAVSYTFDDGMVEHYTVLFPEFKKRNIKGTFAINGAFISGETRKDGAMTWQQMREMVADGQEMSNHAWRHKKLTRLSEEEMRMEVQRNDTLIYNNVGVFPRTFIYPYNSKSDSVVEFCMQDRVGTRTRQVSVGSKRDSTWMRQWVDGLIAKGEWGVGMTHGITYGYDALGDPTRFWKHLDYVCTLRDQLWIATFHDVAAYTSEQEAIKLKVKMKKDKITVKPTLKLDKQLFNHPLTLVVKSEKLFIAKQDGKALSVRHLNGKAIIDFNPHGGKIVIEELKDYIVKELKD